MEQRKRPKHSCSSEIELDRLSSLPGNIIDQILSQLSIRDAVRTSVLSTKWRYKWITLPNLVFDHQCISLTSQDQEVVKSKLINIIDHVLLLHTGPIYKFKLCFKDVIDVIQIERWIIYLSRSPIKELVLDFWIGQLYKLHSCLFSCQNLTHLELFNCLVKPPPTFQGFKNLKSLYLDYVKMRQDIFDNIIVSCPLLERLTLVNFDGFRHLNIDAPNLLLIDVEGVFDDITFTNTTQLAQASILLNAEDKNTNQLPNSGSLLKIFVHLPQIQRLGIGNYFLKYLGAGDVPSRLPNPCLDLSYLSIDLNYHDWGENKAGLCLLRSSPNLQELEIWATTKVGSPTEGCAGFWENEYTSCSFHQLRFVRVFDISGTKLELEFISFLLLASPVLERLIIKPALMNGGLPMTKELLRFQRASTRARIDYLDS